MRNKVRDLIDLEFNNIHQRRKFVETSLANLPSGSRLLDAGSGSQQYREFATHLTYVSQDFEQYGRDSAIGFASSEDHYVYGETDIVGDIWSIAAANESFDAILCTEVLEHIPYPIETIAEFARLLRPNGTLILTAPSNCLRHFDPFFFSSGYSDRWYEHFLPKSGFDIVSLEPVGDYFSWMKVEIFRTITLNPIAIFSLLPALLYFKLRKKTQMSQSTLCMGYHVIAIKR